MRNSDKKRKAKALYVSTDMLKKDIAQQVGITPKTLRGWVTEGDWDMLKESKTITRQELLSDEYEMLKAVNDEIRENHNGVPNKSLSDARATIVKNIETLADLPMHQLTAVFMEYTDWMNVNRPEKLLEHTEFMNEFIEEQATKKRL